MDCEVAKMWKETVMICFLKCYPGNSLKGPGNTILNLSHAGCNLNPGHPDFEGVLITTP